MRSVHRWAGMWRSRKSDRRECFWHPTPAAELPGKSSLSTAATTSWASSQKELLIPDCDSALGVAFPLERYFEVTLIHEARELLPPLNQQDSVCVSQVVQGERIQFALRIDSVKVDVRSEEHT